MSTHKVYSTWQRRREVPQIKIQGRWLEDAGIQIGAALRIRAEGSRLIIEPTEETSKVICFPQIQPSIAAAA